MADVEEDAEFGSHFLDSMLEVQMTEEDKELDISKNCDPLDTLPPVPTFDLHSETLNYKEIYNTFPQPVLATLPLATSTASTVPLVLKSSPVLIYSGDVPASHSAPVITPMQVMTSKPAPRSAAKPPPKPPAKLSLKPGAKPPTRTVKVGVGVKSSPQLLERLDKRFLKQVFLAEFVRNVFVKADDPPKDIAVVSEEEMNYYKTCFEDISKVQSCRLHCTICDKHLGCAVSARKKMNVHNMLKVLTCKPCYEFYGDGVFPCDKGDNCEIYCRWCGQGGALVCCSFCPRVFCKKCVKRNFGLVFLRKIERAKDWACFCCAQKPLWPHRAVCRALMEYIEKKKSEPKLRDTTSCCSVAGLTRQKLRLSEQKNKTVGAETEVKFNPPVRTPDAKSKTYPSPKTVLEEQVVMKPVIRVKSNDKLKIPPPKPKTIPNIFSARSVIAGNNVIRGIATSTPTKLFSAFPSPQFIQNQVSPVVPEPLMSSTPRILVQTSPPGNSGINSSCVRVSLTHQAPTLDVNKIPTVKVPQLVQGLFLRLIFPDNKMQYVRLVFEGTNAQPSSKDHPTPQFKEKESCFVEDNLEEAFNISKLMYDKLMKIKEKVSTRTKFTEKSVLNSSVKKLHVDYENVIELYRELDRTLRENHEEWKNESKKSVDVIDLSDDDSTIPKRGRPGRPPKDARKNANDDSDIEILEDVTVNGNGNFKEKYRLRSSGEPVRMQAKANVKKRRRGRMRNADKRPKMMNGQTEEEDPLKIDDVDTGMKEEKVKNDGERK